jgi:hypothetical protein
MVASIHHDKKEYKEGSLLYNKAKDRLDCVVYRFRLELHHNIPDSKPLLLE